jgi:hypothetical protein
MDPLLVNIERRHAQALLDKAVDEAFPIPPAAPVTMATFPAMSG